MIPLTTAEVQVWFLVHLGILFVASGWMTVSSLLLPGITSRGGERFGRRPWLVFLVGLLIAICATIFIAGLSVLPSPITRGIAGVVTVAIVIIALGGTGALIRAFSQGMVDSENVPQPTLLRRYGISLAIVLTWMLPFAGWFFALPLTLILGLGGFVFGCFPMRAPQGTSEP